MNYVLWSLGKRDRNYFFFVGYIELYGPRDEGLARMLRGLINDDAHRRNGITPRTHMHAGMIYTQSHGGSL